VGRLKVHCCRTISRNGSPGSEDDRRTNSCVRGISFSSKTSAMRLIGWGASKISRIVCIPGSAARQPRPGCIDSDDSTGKSLSSDVTSTVTQCSRSNQFSASAGRLPDDDVTSRFLILGSSPFSELCRPLPGRRSHGSWRTWKLSQTASVRRVGATATSRQLRSQPFVSGEALAAQSRSTRRVLG